MTPRLYQCHRSFCEQDYPEYQIVFGVADRNDTAIPIVTRLMQEFPHRDMTLLVDETARGTKPKVANLINMVGAAKHAFLVISDSDVRIDPECPRGALAIWAVSLVGRSVRWRGRYFSITHDGRLVSPAAPAQLA